MIVQVMADGNLAYDSRLPEEKGYGMESIRVCDTLNKGGSATLILPPQHPLRDGFRAFQTEVVIYRDEKIRWRGRPLPGSCDKYNRRTITCEGELCFLQDATLRPCSMSGDLTTIFTEIINAYNATVEDWKRFEVGSVTVAMDEEVTFSAKSAQLVFAAVQKLIKSYGGYIIFDSMPSGRRRINWYANLPYSCNQRIRWGSNLTDYSTSADSSEFATRIVPYGDMDSDGNRITISVDGKDYVENAEAVAQRGVIEIPKIYDGVTDPAELQAAAQRDVDRACTLPETIQLSALDLSRQDASLDAFCLGQRVNADSDPHKLSGVYNIVSIEEDLVDSRVGMITLTREAEYFDGSGNTLTGSISGESKNDKTERKFVTYLNAVAGLTATLLGANGGAIRLLDTDDDGLKDTLYIADNPDPELAKKVWRFNFEGWGASENGYNGPFKMGATFADGIIADFITAGTLNADLIKTGKIRSADGSITIDLANNKVIVETNVDGKDGRIEISSNNIVGFGWNDVTDEWEETMRLIPGSRQSENGTAPTILDDAESGVGLFLLSNHGTVTIGGANCSLSIFGADTAISMLHGTITLSAADETGEIITVLEAGADGVKFAVPVTVQDREI